MKLDEMTLAADRVSDLMKTLSNKTRLLILCELADGEKSVGELAVRLAARDAAVSQQLALLRRDGLVRRRRDGQTVYYGLARNDIGRLMAFLHQTYCGEPDHNQNH